MKQALVVKGLSISYDCVPVCPFEVRFVVIAASPSKLSSVQSIVFLGERLDFTLGAAFTVPDRIL